MLGPYVKFYTEKSAHKCYSSLLLALNLNLPSLKERRVRVVLIRIHKLHGFKFSLINLALGNALSFFSSR